MLCEEDQPPAKEHNETKKEKVNDASFQRRITNKKVNDTKLETDKSMSPAGAMHLNQNRKLSNFHKNQGGDFQATCYKENNQRLIGKK